MLQNIGPRGYRCDFLPRPPVLEKDFLLLFFVESILLKRENGRLVLPRPGDMPEVVRSGEARYLFAIDDTAFFGADAALDIGADGRDAAANRASGAWLYLPVRELRDFDPSWLAFAAVTGYHLHFWYAHNRYCGACGTKFRHSESERALLCPGCGHLKYPDIAVAVIVGVSDGDKLLLTKYAGRQYKNYALIAGFVEIGESLEDTVRREVGEEVGLCVKNIRYFASQPWGFSRSLLAGFFAEADGSSVIKLDGRELAGAEWVKREDICADPSLISLTATMMEAFKDKNIDGK